MNDSSSENNKWKTTYSVAVLLAVAYILGLGIFTWIFNYGL